MSRDRTDPTRSTPLTEPAGSPESPPPPGFAELARLAAEIFQAPLASIVLSGWSESWFSAGLPLRGLPEDPYLARTLAAPDVFEVQDVAADRRHGGGDAVLNAAGIRSYAGCALRTAAGEVLGAIAIYRQKTIAMSFNERAVLTALARQGVALAELQSRVSELELVSAAEHLAPSPRGAQDSALADSLLDSAPLAIYYGDTQSDSTYVNPEYRRMLRLAPAQNIDDWPQAVHPEDRARMEQGWADFVRRPCATRFEYRALGDGDTVRYYTEHVVPTEGISGYVGTISDITDLVKTRTLLEAVIGDLQRRETELERVHRELVTASREAGRAEVATNVLHNVGNILNSLNISTNVVTERIRQSCAPGVSRLAALLSEHSAGAGKFLTEDPRGRRVPEYLAALGDQLLSDQREALEELKLLRDNIEHIKDTVMMQQSYAKLCGIAETVEVAALVEDSLRLNASAFERHGVQLKREFGDVPPITVDKHKVLQILVNLVRNAKYACDESGRAHKLITLRIEPSARGVRISVIDNGAGIAPENMQHLFRHGFTTRESGHGFGLHSAALAARELEGTLHAESAGAGAGAAFILELPAAAAAPA
ncbi:MAG: ATP-binding protein [Steroidobacteraceae bacterium]|jgi:signal transduction histidine kinase